MQQGATLARVEIGDHAQRAATTSVGPASRARSVAAGMRPSQVPVGPRLGTRRRRAVGSGAWARPGLVLGPTDDPLEHAPDRAATRALTNPSSERRSRGKALAHPGGATAECAAVGVKPSSCSAGGAATPPWSTTLLRWTIWGSHPVDPGRPRRDCPSSSRPQRRRVSPGWLLTQAERKPPSAGRAVGRRLLVCTQLRPRRRRRAGGCLCPAPVTRGPVIGDCPTAPLAAARSLGAGTLAVCRSTPMCRAIVLRIRASRALARAVSLRAGVLSARSRRCPPVGCAGSRSPVGSRPCRRTRSRRSRRGHPAGWLRQGGG